MKERILKKVGIPELILWWAVRIALIFAFIFRSTSVHEGLTLSITASFCCTFLWEILQLFPEKTFFRKISSHLQTFIIIQLFFTEFMGGFLNYYYTIWWWDSAMHAVGGAMLMAIGYELLTAIEKNHDDSKVPISIMIIASAGVAFICGSAWEIMEFCYDQISGCDSQHWDIARMVDDRCLIKYPPAKYPLMDTMEDMICNTVGTAVYTIFLSIFPYHHKSKKK